MTRRMSRFIALLVTLSFLITFFSFSVAGNKALAFTSKVKTLKPITFTALTTYTVGGTAWGKDPISKKITQKTGVTLNLEYTVGDFNEKLSLLLASGDYPDIILSVDNYQLQDMIDANAAIPLDGYLKTGGANIKKAFGDKLGAMKNETDGKIYGFNKEFGAIPPKRDCYIQIQYPVLKEFGYPKINTLDELGDLIEKYIKKYKTYNGMDLIGILSPAGGDALRHGINNTAMRASGFQDDGEFIIDPINYNATYAMRTPQTKAYLKWLNKMANKKLFAMDSFSLDHPGVVAEVAKGNVLCVTEPWWALDETEKAIRTINQTPERCYAKIPIYINKEAAKNSQVSNYDSLGTWKSVITNKCKDPQRAFTFFDTMWSEEMQTLCWWGVEGDLYTVKNGKRVLKPETLKAQQNDANFRTKTGVLLYDYWSKGSLVKDSTGQYLNPYMTTETIASAYTKQDIEVIKAYDKKAVTWADLWPVPQLSKWGFAWKLSLPKSDGADAQTEIKQSIAGKYMYKMVQSKTDAMFEDNWKQFVSECLKAGIQKREKEVTDAIKKRMKLWYGK